MSTYPAAHIDVAVVLALAVVVVAQIVGAMKLYSLAVRVYELYAEIQRSMPANLARQLDEVQTDVALLVRGMDPRLLIKLDVADKQHAEKLAAQQATLNTHTALLADHEARLTVIEQE